MVVLIGAPGAGKTTVGQAVAQILAAPFTDTDDLVAAAASAAGAVATSAAEVLTEQGEERFRALEHDAALTSLQLPGVVVLGGGAPCDPAVSEALAVSGLPIVWLRVTAPNAISRLGLNAIRPVSLGNVRAQFAAGLKQREQWYDKVATHVVDTDHREVSDIAADVVDWVRGAPDDQEIR